jgi:hypothetical protein
MSVADTELSDRPPSRLMKAMTRLADEFHAIIVRITAYLCGITVLALIATDLISRFQDDADFAPRPILRESPWSEVERPQPAFAAPSPELDGKTATYQTLRHAAGGRKDLLQWSEAGIALPFASIEIYRPGDELTAFAPPTVEIKARTALWNVPEVQAAGVIVTKFGPASLVAFETTAAGRPFSCAGFVRSFETPRFEIDGWTCQGDTAPARRQAAACLLNRLTLLAAGSDPAFAEKFARAELKREFGCETIDASIRPIWLDTMDDPHLRGTLASQ